MRTFHNHMDGIELSKIRLIGEKAARMAEEGRSIVKLQIGEPDFDTPKRVINSAIVSLQNRETHYTSNRGTVELRRAISDKLWRDNGIKADPVKNILVVSGCAEALMCACLGLLDRGDEMIVVEPCFINYVQLAKILGATPVIVHADETNGWLPDPDDIRRAVTAKTKMILLCSPNNPTGVVYPEQTLREIAAIAIENDLIVVSDEVYEKLVYSAKNISIASLPGMEERTVTINGLSKAYAMTGWRVGYITACEELILPMLKMHQYCTTCMPAFVQAGAVEALNNCEAEVDTMRQMYEARRDLVFGLLQEFEDLSVVAPGGTFYIYPNISRTGLDSETFVMRLLEEQGVATVFGSAFDHTCGKDNIRISFANSEENLREGIARLKNFLESLY